MQGTNHETSRAIHRLFFSMRVLLAFDIAREGARVQGKDRQELRRFGRMVAEAIRPPKDAPNVIIFLLDDMGFAQIGSFGGLIETPNIDRLAAGGLRYNNFHTTALCSPSRATLMAGRNPHSIGLGSHALTAMGFPATTPSFRRRPSRWRTICKRRATSTTPWANGTTRRCTKSPRSVPSIAGPATRDSPTPIASWRPTCTSSFP